MAYILPLAAEPIQPPPPVAPVGSPVAPKVADNVAAPGQGGGPGGAAGPAPLSGPSRARLADETLAEVDRLARQDDSPEPGGTANPFELSPEEKAEVARLQRIDAKVRAHEQAHQAAGGPYTGPASIQTVTGPDGRQYAVAGEVSIDVSAVNGDPEATIRKMEAIKRAALAPAEPSPQDRAVAAQAEAVAAQAEAELARMKNEAQRAEREESEATPQPGRLDAVLAEQRLAMRGNDDGASGQGLTRPGSLLNLLA
ncbi:putative metalloprotease CJM1_0395 family protein [Roseospirillum parvum]|uniref:SprA-related family protein n=1 Tax=Roseospirillum parvum TaxID=83401 RepID=A0A1G7YB19_9PROT|nr:putative metalloprotease CJM1_0395 family protein [Roseospirillum parvum]SDG93585.1 SprA-related family protein [Roseospirillum parvum]